MYGSEISCERMILTAGMMQYVSGFSCGVENIDLSEYLASSALHDEDNVTYLYVDADTQKVIAYAVHFLFDSQLWQRSAFQRRNPY